MATTGTLSSFCGCRLQLFPSILDQIQILLSLFSHLDRKTRENKFTLSKHQSYSLILIRFTLVWRSSCLDNTVTLKSLCEPQESVLASQPRQRSALLIQVIICSMVQGTRKSLLLLQSELFRRLDPAGAFSLDQTA